MSGDVVALVVAGDVVDEPLLPADAALRVDRPVPDPDRLAERAAPPDRVEHWRGRMAEVAEVRKDQRS